MAAYEPIAAEHAVEQAIVGVRWRQKPTDERFAAAVESASQIAQQFGLPGKLQLDAFSLLVSRQIISFGYDGPQEPQTGYVFQQVYPDGSMAQEMTLERGAVTFRTRNYRRWSDIQEIIEGVIRPLTEILCEDDSSRVSVIEFRCNDRFLSNSDEVPPLSDLIRLDTRFVPDRLKGLSTYLHSHLGWFEEVNGHGRILYNLNIAIQDDESAKRPAANVLQVISRHFPPEAAASASLGELLVSTFDDLHARDKGLLMAVLSEHLVESINLKGNTVAVTV